MATLKTSLQQLSARANALSARDRALLGAIIAGAVIALGNSFVYQPFSAEHKRLKTDISSAQQQVAALEQQMLAFSATPPGADPNLQNRTQLATLKKENADLDHAVAHMMEGLIEPAQMARVLEEALNRESGLTLVRAKNLGATPLTPATDPAATPVGPILYKHGLVIEFDGSYLAALRYLKALEALPWRLFWDGVELRVQKFPQAHITITVHTLSLKEGWIGV